MRAPLDANADRRSERLKFLNWGRALHVPLNMVPIKYNQTNFL